MLSLNNLPNHISGEKNVLVLRRDIFILFKRAGLFFLLTVLPPAAFYLLFRNNISAIMAEPLYFSLLILGASAYYTSIWLFFFFSFIDYYLDVWIITTERIIDIEQDGFFSRTISEHRLSRVQDATSEVHGLFATVFDYGDVYVQTAGTKQRFFFHEVPRPEEVRRTIIKLVEKSKKNHSISN